MNHLLYFARKEKQTNQKLQKAIINREIDKVNDALAQGADVNANTSIGITPLELALSVYDNEEIVLALIRSGADLNQIDATIQQNLNPSYIDIINAELNSRQREEINSRNGIGGKRTKRNKTKRNRTKRNKNRKSKK
jgi:ankyrin repeat protein